MTHHVQQARSQVVVRVTVCTNLNIVPSGLPYDPLRQKILTRRSVQTSISRCGCTAPSMVTVFTANSRWVRIKGY